jgi:CIC family chloride channel protein
VGRQGDEPADGGDLGILIGAGVLVGVAQFLLTRLSSGNGIDITSAIWFYAVRCVAWADGHKPKGGARRLAPMLALGLLGAASIPFPQLLGNGRDVAELAFKGQLGAGILVVLLLLRPAATIMCLGSGAPGGLFTPSLTVGAMLGGVLGVVWSWLWPGVPPGLFAMLGAAGMLAATTQGPISTVVLMMELTGYARAAIVPMIVVVATATLIARTIEPRSIYDARLTDAEVRARQQARDRAAGETPK